MTTLTELENTLSARIAALDATDYVQNANYPETWTESKLPLTEVADSTQEAHLAYSVSVEETEAFDDGHPSAGFLSTLVSVEVRFLYRLRTENQRGDTRDGAILAAHDILKTIMQPSPLWGRAFAQVPYEPQAMEGQFLPVRLSFQFLIDLSI